MSELRNLIIKLRSKEYYVRLIEIFVINGLLDIIEEELKDNKINYLSLMLNLLNFLDKNKKYYKNFSSDKFENIIILSIDEILTKKFKTEIDEEQLKMILNLAKNSYLFKTIIMYIKDFLIKIYFKCKHKSCYKTNDVVEIDKSKHSTSELNNT